MKLFKKKTATPKATKPSKPKKPLFGIGKKPSKTSVSTIDQFSDNTQASLDEFSQQPQTAQTAKKSGLFGKKTATPKPVVSSAKASQKPKSLQLDPKKLLPIFGGLLALVLVALAIKMFVFNDEPAQPLPEPQVAQETPTEVMPEPTQADQLAEPAVPMDTQAPQVLADSSEMSEMPADTQVVADTQTDTQIANDVNTDTTAPSGQANQPVAPAVKPLTHAEFIQEANKKVYRERNTDPASLPPAQ